MKTADTQINTRAAWSPLKRPVASLVIAAQLALVLQPLSVLAQEKGTTPFNPGAQAQLQRLGALNQSIEQAKAAKTKEQSSPADKASAELARIEEISKVLNADQRARGPATVLGGKDAKDLRAIGPNIRIEVQRQASSDKAFILTDSQRSAQTAELKALFERQQTAQNAIKAEFTATRQELEQKKLPAEILARHDQAVRDFEQRAEQFNAIAQKIQSNQLPAQADRAQAATKSKADGDASALQELSAFFSQYPNSKRPSTPDLSKLPWSTPQPNKRLPAETKTAWHQNLHKNFYAGQAVRLAQAGTAGNIAGIQFTQLPEPGMAPSPADLSETPDTLLTAGIRAKALELGNNPLQIHNWARNTLQWQPTWGSIQGADNTLKSQRGNAFDIASLEIALLRAAGIPARYQFSTIDIPAEQVMNWVGGASKPEAALQIINQGGIAARGIAEAGRIKTIRMEHVWVNAYVNWTPSRGAKDGGYNLNPKQHVNPNANLNAWVPLDASFKQYSYTSGLDLKTAVPLDANALLNAAQQGATVNAAQGWVQNLNQANVQTELNNYQARLKTYIDGTPTGANSTVGDVIGKQIIPQQSFPLLAGTLQHPIVQLGSEMAVLPDNLQHKFTYRLSDEWGTELLSYTERTSQLTGKRLTLSYIPATQSDADTIATYLPKANADGSPIRPDQLPTSLPGYLIKLKAQINLDGTPVATSNNALAMGSDLRSTGGFTQLYDLTQWDLTSEESNVVGQATAIGISAGGISAAQLTTLKDRLTVTQGKLQAASTNPGNATATLAGITGEQISGDLLTATIWSWFAAAESHNRLSQNQAGMIETPGLSYGLFHAIAQAQYSWGVIRKVTFPGVNMDIGHVRNITWAKDNSESAWIGYNRLRGQYMSALEHAIAERFFNDPAQCNPEGTTTPNAALPVCPQGISAVKAVALGAQAGQKIYTITPEVYQNNPNIVSSNLSAHSPSTRQAVQNRLDAGYEVTIHENPITQSGWTGSGYTFIDPATGAGGYIIDGGSNGGNLGTAIFGLAAVFAMGGLATKAAFLGLAASLSPFVLLAIGIAVAILAIYSAITGINSSYSEPAVSLIEAITSIATLGVFAIATGFPILFAILLISLLLIIARQAYLAFCTFNDGKC